MYTRKCVIFLFIVCIYESKSTIIFERSILAVGFPYYKMQLTLGTCKDVPIFEEHKIWGSVKLNQVLDIYYESESPGVRVSRVEIVVVVNNTNCYAMSEKGVGSHIFAGTLFISTHVSAMFYRLTIYTCNNISGKSNGA